MTKLYIPYPEPKVHKIDIPHSSGSVDVTADTGNVNYSDREGLELEFKAYCKSYAEWKILLQEIAAHIHGKKLKMICDDDKDHYYMVRLKLDSTRSNNVNSTVVLSGTADPFKYALIASNEPWLWDTFNFKTGEIVFIDDITVNGTATVTVKSGNIPTSPTFYVFDSENLAVVYNDRSYPLPKNSVKAYEVYRFPQIKVADEDVTFTFTGKGKVSVEYRGRFL